MQPGEIKYRRRLRGRFTSSFSGSTLEGVAVIAVIAVEVGVDVTVSEGCVGRVGGLGLMGVMLGNGPDTVAERVALSGIGVPFLIDPSGVLRGGVVNSVTAESTEASVCTGVVGTAEPEAAPSILWGLIGAGEMGNAKRAASLANRLSLNPCLKNSLLIPLFLK